MNDLLSAHLDILFLSETWLSATLISVTHDLVPKAYDILYANRESKRGGGVAVIHKDSLNITELAGSMDLGGCDSILALIQIHPKFT